MLAGEFLAIGQLQSLSSLPSSSIHRRNVSWCLLIVGFRVPMSGCYFETLGLKADFVFCIQPAQCARLLKHELSIRVMVIIILLDKEHTKNMVPRVSV